MPNIQEYHRDKEGSNISKIVVDRDLCIGAQSCIAPGGDTFELDSENKAIVNDANSVDDSALMAAAQACPTRAILLYDKEGKQLN